MNISLAIYTSRCDVGFHHITDIGGISLKVSDFVQRGHSKNSPD